MEDEGHTVDIITSSYLIGILAILTLGSLLAGVLAMFGGAFSEAGRIGALSTALATVLLVVVTLRYVRLTSELVNVTKEARERERKQRERERQEDLDSLRRALIREISTIEGFEEFGDSYGLKASLLDFVTSTTVYEANADQLGRLTEKEADSVVEFYGRVEQLEAFLKMQRELDTPYKKDSITRYFKTTFLYQEEIIRRLTGGRIAPDKRDYRTENISDKFKELAEAQDEALEHLQDQL